MHSNAIYTYVHSPTYAHTHTHTVTPSIEQHPQNLSNVLEWTEVTITCAAQGNPPPTITWERQGGGVLPVNVQENTRIENDTLVSLEINIITGQTSFTCWCT